jgi:hypothetical protein
MADLRISELNTLPGAGLVAGDYIAIADNSASETRKITVVDYIGYGVTLVADDTIPSGKILFNAETVPGSALENLAVDTNQIATGAVTANKLADFSSVTLVSSLPASGAFRGQIALDTNDLKIYSWNGSQWLQIKAAGSINAIVGGSAGVVNVTSSRVGDTVTLNTTLDDTAVGGQFLAGPAGGAGAVAYRKIESTDLPTATTTAKGAVLVNGEGLTLDGDRIEINNTVTPSSAEFHVVEYNEKGLVTNGRVVSGSDLPAAQTTTKGAVFPGSGLNVLSSGELNHSNSVTAGTYGKVTVDTEGHVTAGLSLEAADIPELDASKITSGELSTARYAPGSVTGVKLANSSVTKIGGANATDGVVTFPTPEFTGQYFFDSINGDLYLWDGNAWQPITITAGEIIYAGTFDASAAAGLGEVASVTTAGSAIGLTVGSALPAASETNNRYYLVVSVGGTITGGNAPNTALAAPDMILSNGTTWEEIDVSTSVTGATQASNITVTPAGAIQSTNVQAALEELDTEKIGAAGATITGDLIIGTTGGFAFEGSTADAYETYLTAVDPTADRTITLPNVSGTVITTGDTGTVTSAMLAGSIALSKLATVASGNIIVGNSSNQAASVAVTGDITISNSGVVDIAAGVIVNTDIDANAGISFSKLATLTSGSIIVGNSSNVPAAVAVTGDVTISNTGVTSIASGAIVNADVSASAEIAVSKLADGAARQLLQTDAAGTGVEWTSNVDISGTLDVTGVGTFDAATRGSVGTLTDAATITPDFAAANHFSVTLAGNRTLANPTNLVAGQSGAIFITQDGTGSRTLTYGTYWKFAGGTLPTLSTAAGAVDMLVYVVKSSTEVYASLSNNMS